ncbi:MAG: hypothetical protein WCH77_02710 [Planctomycetota bacterium]
MDEASDQNTSRYQRGVGGKKAVGFDCQRASYPAPTGGFTIGDPDSISSRRFRFHEVDAP